LEVLLWAKVVALVRGLDHSDGWVGPEDSVVEPPLVIGTTPFLSGVLSWCPPCICGPHIVSGLNVLGFGSLSGFKEDLDKYVFDSIKLEVVEDVELAVITETLGSKELGLFFRHNGGQRSGVSNKG
jgi:hypothetical protein